MATFCYSVRSTLKNKLAKVQIHFTVGRGNQFYADTQYLVLTDAWDSKRQTVKSRYAAVEDFTEQQGRELMKNLSELRSFILGEIAKDPEHAMTKTKLEKIVYAFHHPRSIIGGKRVRNREPLSDYIARYVRENGNGDATFSVANITVFGVNVADAAFAADGQLDLDFANKTGDSNIASKKRYSKEQMQRVILDSCQDYSSLEEIADRVGRSAQYIIKDYVL